MHQNLALKIAITTSGKRQRQIAASTGIPENRLSTLVNGWAPPRDHERDAIAAALGKPADELFAGEQRQARAAAERRWLTLKQASAVVQVHASTLRREIYRGRLRHARVGGRKSIRLRRSWVDAWLEASSAPIEVPRGSH